MKWAVIGCGYTGQRLVRRLLGAGHRVTATVRDPAAAAALASHLGIAVSALDLEDPARGGSLATMLPGAVVVDCVPPGSPAGRAEKILVQACARLGAARLVYLSSTGVYGAANGEWVDESAPAAPAADHGVHRLAAETAILREAGNAGLSAVALRIAGIYGPGRGVQARLRGGGYRVIGAGDSYVSRIHVDDLVDVIIAAGTADPLPARIYNVADDEPTTAREHADAVAALLGLPPPPSMPEHEASPMARALLGGNRKIANDRMKRDLGIALRYPTWRQGLAATLRDE